jgi:superoxide reductase
MKRRDFIRLSAIGAGISLISPAITLAGETKPVESKDIYYTKEAPGRWASKAATHSPLIEVTKAEDGTTIKIITPHEMKGYEHYIVKHILLDKNYKFIDEYLFDPTKNHEAISTYTLKDYRGTVYALSTCNKHDLWLGQAEV